MYGCLRKGNDMDEFAARPVADILARYSTDNQNPVTIDVQVEKCREWCERNCCFSKRMRKLFRKNEKSVLRFCNKSSKTKRAFTKVLMPCKRPF